MSHRFRQTRFPLLPMQLALPLDYSQSERDALSRNRAPLKGKRWRRWQDHLATSQAIRERRDIVQASCLPNSNKFRQRQRFALTSTLINDVNGNRWRTNVFALP